jgi:hypothetical protein
MTRYAAGSRPLNFRVILESSSSAPCILSRIRFELLELAQVSLLSQLSQLSLLRLAREDKSKDAVDLFIFSVRKLVKVRVWCRWL